MLTFISGGVRSGKSRLAEQLAEQDAETRGGALFYLATAATPQESEMQARIRWHQQDRGKAWITLEEPIDLNAVLPRLQANSTLLLDCLTLWSSQVMFASDFSPKEAIEELDAFIQALTDQQIHLIIVSNDINECLPPNTPELLNYVRFLQCLHQCLTAQADHVIQMLGGCAYDWKGG
ncbi:MULTISPECIES: bifunctional adenosylcobinamide kinase/adenosylcobinamide-phosphate guanylyltransferase [Nitrincola]|uniref:Bifunctional adenosylcobalamin biosynthesis protein n=1 Tax=Nitrincola nitratireducens TaxID=1229521 RepID=W9V7Q7_9GAMM|nr:MULTISPECIES: bifunctional adenosylcobinamide kinase/adenosylcobinamide-phosphate guanylyltransferase [Nitrincola]EXJ12911.1 Adenosylcobinamide kinase [Nitrincola nitratireducens]